LQTDRRVPPSLVEHVEDFLAGRREPVEPTGAATVLLLRPADPGIEVYLLRRHSQMPFAAGMYAFPGGRVDPRDSDTAVAWAGPSPEEWAARFGCSASEARALVCAAVRETFEESGVLLAGTTGSDVVADTTADDWEADRAALVNRSLAFTEFLVRRGLVVRTDLLAYWAHWITPEFEPRRYDTRFFLAALPVGQQARDVSGEADRVAWMRPADALAAVDEGRIEMFPPTYVTIRDLPERADPAEALASAEGRVIETVMPRVELVDGEPTFVGADDDWSPRRH
jgi:8-oxo-dGTP pyrophosphatase MutT (NUDIX family)